jgi:hypothetical protein
LGDERKEQV